MNDKPKKSLQYYMRVLHRNLGFLALGMVVVYALSGILLIHRADDFLKTSTQVEQTLAPGLCGDQLGEALKMKRLKVTDETESVITFDNGTYDKATGHASYVVKDYVFPFNKFANLHKMPCAQNRHVGWFTTLFGVVLLFLGISSLFMFKTGAKQFKSNMIYTVIGVALTIVLLAAL